MRIVAAGVSGFIGTRLTTALTDAGHQVTRLTRSGPTGPGESHWDPDTGQLDSAVLEGADAVINLCGVPASTDNVDRRLQAPASGPPG